MSTFLFSLAGMVPEKLSEVYAIVERAESCVEDDAVLYSILCRAGSVMLVSALEAFLKDVDDAIQSDVNAFIGGFADLPPGLQRAFAHKIAYLEGASEGDVAKRVKQLIEYFKVHSVEIDLSAFPYKENRNKNPSSNMIDSVFGKYGVVSTLHCLRGTVFEAVFDGDRSSNVILYRNIRRARSTLYRFPYANVLAPLSFVDWVHKKGEQPPTSLWHEYISRILMRRHGVVHAETRDNATSASALRKDLVKLEALFFGIIYSVASIVGRDMRERSLNL